MYGYFIGQIPLRSRLFFASEACNKRQPKHACFETVEGTRRKHPQTRGEQRPPGLNWGLNPEPFYCEETKLTTKLLCYYP